MTEDQQLEIETPAPPQRELVTVKFRNAGKQYDFDTNSLELHYNDDVVVETNRGRALGRVVRPPRHVNEDNCPAELKKVLRLATEADHTMASISTAKEREAFAYCQERIRQRTMGMKLVKAEYLFDGSKIIFYFTADGRIDFRDLVKDLAHHFHTRIEMRQIGVRDEAKLIGGIGICGRELCCGTFLTDFHPVSVKMAKQQGLALNPSKISGQCGRLLCCLGYEYDTYCQLAKQLPKNGSKILLDGETAEVVSSQILNQSVTLRTEQKTVTVSLAKLQDQRDTAPDKPQENARKNSRPDDRNESSADSNRPSSASGNEAPAAGNTKETAHGSDREPNRRQPRGNRRPGKPQERSKPSGEENRSEGKPAKAKRPQTTSDPGTKKQRERRPEQAATKNEPSSSTRPESSPAAQENRPPKRRNRGRRRPRKPVQE
ncbi:MAG: hypothetical protein JXR59_00370 [Desulfuromonadaceae bacterium]|nr:hypothetical protein [Desulfuromonadaceae bacterium]